jgi:hypothetical protein
MKILSVGGDLFHEDRWTQTDRHDEGNTRFRNFANAPKKNGQGGKHQILHTQSTGLEFFCYVT